MRRRTVVATALGLAMMLSPAGVRAFGVNDVIKLHQEQVSDSLIVMKIQHTGKVFHVSSSDFRKLKQAGVSDQVMSAMLRTEQVGFQKNASYAAPPVYVHYPYDPLPYWQPSFVFGFHYGYGPRFGLHYRYPFRRW